MAITLPSITINDPVKEERVLNAFKPTPTSTPAEAATEYRRWLVSKLTQEVIDRERTEVHQQALATIKQKESEIHAMLDGA